MSTLNLVPVFSKNGVVFRHHSSKPLIYMDLKIAESDNSDNVNLKFGPAQVVTACNGFNGILQAGMRPEGTREQRQ